MPCAMVSLYSSSKWTSSPDLAATCCASALLSVVKAGALVNRPVVRYHPASAAVAVSSRTSRKASQPRRRFCA